MATTYGTLKSEIAADIDRDDLETQIGNAIIAAIRTVETTKLRFNNEVTTTTMTEGSAYLALPSAFFAMDSIKYDAGSYQTILEWRTLAEIEQMDTQDGYTNPPLYYTISDNQIRLYPVPDDDYSTTIQFWETFTDPSADGDENEWINNARNYIKWKARSILAASALFDYEQANYFDAMAQRELQRLEYAHIDEIEDYSLALRGSA